MAKFYTNLPVLGTFTENVTVIEDSIERRYTDIQAAVDASKQNVLQKLRRLVEMEQKGKDIKNPGQALKLGFDESIIEHLHSCVNIQLSKEFRKSCSYDETPPEAISPQPPSSKDSLDVPSMEMKRSYSPLPEEFNLTPSPIIPSQYKKNSLPNIASVSKGKSDDNVGHAFGLAVHPTTGDVYIADSGNGSIKVFDSNGEFKLKFGSEDCNPYGIAISDELIYITNWGINNFRVYQNEGTLVKEAEIPILNKPRGIAVDNIGNAYVCSTGNNKVAFVNKDALFCDSVIFATKFAFREPRDVKIHNENIVILDDDNPSLHFFTPQGEHQTSIVANFIQIVTPFAHAYIYDPGFFDMRSDGTIFVSDRQRHYIKIYSPEGKYVTRIGKEGDSIGTFRDPEGLAIGPDGKLYTVCNRKNNLLQIFN